MAGVIRGRVAARHAVALIAAACTLLYRFQRAAWVPPKVWKAPPVDSGSPGENRATAGPRTEQELEVGEHPIQLYALFTPNGAKAAIMLEEICEAVPDFDYDAWYTAINGSQFTTGFCEINPNSKIPVIVDHSTSPPTRVFESGAILIYLAEKYPECNLLPKDHARRTETLCWLMWQMGSAPFVGGGFGHFFAFARDKLEYPINRFTMETKRQLSVLDQQLAKNRFVAGDEYTIADIAIWPWYGGLVLHDVYTGSGEFLNVKEYKNIIRWASELEEQRPAVRKGRMLFRPERPSGRLYEDLPVLRERHGRTDWDQKP